MTRNILDTAFLKLSSTKPVFKPVQLDPLVIESARVSVEVGGRTFTLYKKDTKKTTGY